MKGIYISTFILFFILPQLVMGQKSVVYYELNSAVNYVNKANGYANSIIYNIDRSLQQTAIPDIQYYARQARTESGYAVTEADYAEVNTTKAADVSDEIKCYDAKYKGDTAKEKLYTAIEKLEDASAVLINAEYGDNQENIMNQLYKAKSYAEEGISNLNDALYYMKLALDALNSCE